MRGRQTPSTQLSVLPQGTAEDPWPSALQTTRWELPAQEIPLPGVHVKGTQVLLIALQPLPEGQAVIAP
jgi:hypothetical protein